MKHLLLIGCIAAIAAGFFLIMGGKLLGVVFFVVGIGLGIVYAAIMLKTAGFLGEGAFFHGIDGKGRQQSEVVKADTFQSGEQTAAIWDEMTKDKE